jgi:hypothetical protein
VICDLIKWLTKSFLVKTSSKKFLDVVAIAKGFRRNSGVQAFRKISGLVLTTAVIATLVTGCETGRGNKRHSAVDHLSDTTTTGHPDPALAANGEGLPPVPGSPTAAGVDGKQPYNDRDARPSPGVDDGRSAPPNRLTNDNNFKRQ